MIADIFHCVGRIGPDAPAEHIIASMTAVVGAYAFPNVVAFVHRFNRRILVRSILVLTLVSGVAMFVFKQREVFDEMHQKRLFVIHMENVSTLPSDASTLLTCFGASDHDKRKPFAHRKRGRCARLRGYYEHCY